MRSSLAFQRLAVLTSWFIQTQCIRRVTLHREQALREGGFVLACSHLSHLEPFLIAGVLRRPVEYMARVEFFQGRLAVGLLELLGAFPVNRQAYALTPLRTAIARARAGKIVGIFPEGGVKRGPASAMLGGPIKLGACVVAQRAHCPIVPVVVLGAATLNRVSPWLPAKRGRLWLAFGEPIWPYPGEPRRTDRLRMGVQLATSFQNLYRELCTTQVIDPAALA